MSSDGSSFNVYYTLPTALIGAPFPEKKYSSEETKPLIGDGKDHTVSESCSEDRDKIAKLFAERSKHIVRRGDLSYMRLSRKDIDTHYTWFVDSEREMYRRLRRSKENKGTIICGTKKTAYMLEGSSPPDLLFLRYDRKGGEPCKKEGFEAIQRYYPNMRQRYAELDELRGIPGVIIGDPVYYESHKYEGLNKLGLIVPRKGKDLYMLLEEPNSFDEDEKLDIMQQVLEIIGKVHRRRWAHRDLKPENTLVVREEGGELRVFVTDFDDAEKESEMPVWSLRGTGCYAAPELYSNKGFTVEELQRADVFSLGVLMRALFLSEKEVPEWDIGLMEMWKEESLTEVELLMAHQEAEENFERCFWVDASGPWVDVCKKMTNFDPEKRISIQQALSEVKALRNVGDCCCVIQ
jgi:hypothetical protein